MIGETARRMIFAGLLLAAGACSRQPLAQPVETKEEALQIAMRTLSEDLRKSAGPFRVTLRDGDWIVAGRTLPYKTGTTQTLVVVSKATGKARTGFKQTAAVNLNLKP